MMLALLLAAVACENPKPELAVTVHPFVCDMNWWRGRSFDAYFLHGSHEDRAERVCQSHRTVGATGMEQTRPGDGLLVSTTGSGVYRAGVCWPADAVQVQQYICTDDPSRQVSTCRRKPLVYARGTFTMCFSSDPMGCP